MALRALLRDLVPPVLVRLIRNLRGGLRGGYPWAGIYHRYADVPSRGAGYQGSELARRAYADTERLLQATRERTLLPRFAGGVHGLLGLTAGLVGQRTGRFRVLDFGGGMGIGFVHLLANLRGPCAIEYHVVETEAMCRGGRELFRDDRRISFHPELPADVGDLDVVYVSSALQYVDDYQGTLRRLCGYGASFVLLTNLSAGDVPTYATAQQNLRGLRLPYWFLNASELVDLVRAAGYAVVFTSLVDRVYDRSNFPAAYRVTQPCNLLFTKGAAGGEASG